MSEVVEPARPRPMGEAAWKEAVGLWALAFAAIAITRAIGPVSGYAKAVSGRTYAFSILANRVRSTADAKVSEDRIVMAIVDKG